MCLQLLGFCKYALEESAGLDLLDWLVDTHDSTTANDAVNVLAVTAKTVTIREETQGVLPANKFTTHLENWTVRVHGTLFVQ
jgi:hypothetical protein